MPRFRDISRRATAYTISESTRALFERIASDIFAEEMKDPEKRRLFHEQARKDYKEAFRRLFAQPKARRARAGKQRAARKLRDRDTAKAAAKAP